MDETISLLPFIEPEGDGFLLDIPVFDRDRTSSQGYSYPFQLAGKGQNFSIIVKAGVKVNDADRFKSLFLLVQRDDYPLSPDGLIPYTNTGIDRIWYETIQSYSTDENVFIVPKQLRRKKNATAFTALFYCKKQQRFFHPPCPECGEVLDLCRDDDLLISQSLPPFSTSLKRYLFCPRCHAAKTNYEFYQFSRSADDPVFIKDRFDLIKDFSKLKSTVSGRFPCPTCPGHAECYITGEKAASCISFFSFYPFHMLFFDAEPINALDFLPLISGAPVEEMNGYSAKVSGSDGEKSLFFFDGEDRFFLEVLFLKLSFFEEFSRSLFQRLEKKNYFLMNLSAQSIWVRPQSTGNNLPFFWSFKLRIIDLMVNSPKNYIQSDLTKKMGLHFVTSLWFYTFLVNADQGQEKVYEAVGKLLEKDLKDPLFSDYSQLINEVPSVAMENIFQHHDDRSIPLKWHEFWLRVLVTGLGIFNGEKDQGMTGELNQLINEIKKLKHDIKEELFSKRMAPAPVDQKLASPIIEETPGHSERQMLSSSERQGILQILKQVKTKWVDPEETSPDPDEDVLETIVLSSPPVEEDAGFDDILEKTMIMQGPQIEPAGDGGFDDMEETIIISPAEESQKDPGFFSENDDLDKTLVISPEKKS